MDAVGGSKNGLSSVTSYELLPEQGMAKKSTLVRVLAPYYLLGVIFGYPMLTVITLLIGIQSTALSIAYRFVFVCFGLLLIAWSVMADKEIRFLKSGLPFLFFWVLYGIIMINDISIEGVKMGNRSPAYLYSFLFGSSMMSYVTLYFCGKFIVFDRSLAKKLFLTVFTSNVLIASYLLLSGGLSLEALAVRASIDTETGNVLNPIFIGQVGLFGFVVSVTSLFLFDNKTKLQTLLLLAGVGLGFSNILLGGSRGPILVGAILLLLIGYYYYAYHRITRLLVLKSSLAFATVIGVLFAIVIPFLASIKISVFTRLERMSQQRAEGGKEIRDYEWESAIRQFLDHPALGDKYINDFDNFYPHNVYLEVLMSTGVLGGAMFFTGLAIVFYKIFVVFHTKSAVRFVFVMIVMIILLGRFTSGALHQTPDFWAVLGLMVSMPLYLPKSLNGFYMK